jgi:hypothetical protein
MHWRQPLSQPFNQSPPTKKKGRGLGSSIAIAAIFAALVIGSASYFNAGHPLIAQLNGNLGQ